MTRLVGAMAVVMAVLVANSALAQSGSDRPRRTRIVITPQQGYLIEPPPTARRYCRSWLEQEFRVSGTVIVPRMQCWWQ
jgi:hypothetical protein